LDSTARGMQCLREDRGHNHHREGLTMTTNSALASLRSLRLRRLLAGAVVLACAAVVFTGSPAWGGAEKIVFTHTSEKLGEQFIQAEIYLMNPDGSKPSRLTNDASADANPVLSPDGKGKIVFDSNRIAAAGLSCVPPSLPKGCVDSDLFLITADGTEPLIPTPLTARVGTDAVGGSSASWDPTSKNIAFHRSASGTYGTKLPGRGEPGGPTRDSDIFLVNLDDLLENGKEPTNLTNGLPSLPLPPNCAAPCRFASDDPDWSPDGKWIAFTSRAVNQDTGVVDQPSRGIYVVKLMTGEVTKLTNLNNEVLEERSPAWSPDGKHIAFMRRRPDVTPQSFEIWVLHLNVSTETIEVVGSDRLTTNLFPDLAPAWSLTGEAIVFQTARPSPTGDPPQQTNNQIWVIPANGCPTSEPCEKALTGTDKSAPPRALLGQNFFPKWGRNEN
jgi:TolB protein